MGVRMVAMLALGAAFVACAPARADEPLAGGQLFTVSHGQPFCVSRGALQALLRAEIAESPDSPLRTGACRYVDDNTVVTVTEDLTPGGRYMHVVKARAKVLFGTVDGYTYSVGLYPYPVRQPPFNPVLPFTLY